MVIADTSVWITFQRDPDSAVGRGMDSLLANDEVVMAGPVLTEGAMSVDEFAFFAERLKSLAFLDTDQNTWVQAGELNFQLRKQGSIVAFADLIVSAIAIQHDVSVYTTDGDFERVPGLQLHEPRDNRDDRV